MVVCCIWIPAVPQQSLVCYVNVLIVLTSIYGVNSSIKISVEFMGTMLLFIEAYMLRDEQLNFSDFYPKIN